MGDSAVAARAVQRVGLAAALDWEAAAEKEAEKACCTPAVEFGSILLALLLIVLSLFSSALGRGLLRDLFWSVFVSTMLGLIGARVVSEAWPDLLPEFVATEEIPPYPTLRPMLVVIVALVLGRYVNSHAQRLLR